MRCEVTSPHNENVLFLSFSSLTLLFQFECNNSHKNARGEELKFVTRLEIVRKSASKQPFFPNNIGFFTIFQRMANFCSRSIVDVFRLCVTGSPTYHIVPYLPSLMKSLLKSVISRRQAYLNYSICAFTSISITENFLKSFFCASIKSLSTHHDFHVFFWTV